jgi:hypothetical protein
LAIRSLAAVASTGIAASGDPLGPQHGGLDLVGCQHQGRHVVSGLQHIADARLAADGRPLADQGGDVAINAAFGGLQFRRHGVGRDRLAAAAEDLDDLEKAFGASHGPLCSTDADSMLAAGWR